MIVSKLLPQLSVKYIIIVPIFLLVSISYIAVTNILIDYSQKNQIDNFIVRNTNNIQTLIPTLAFSIWEFNYDRVSRTISGLDDKNSFIFSAVMIDSQTFISHGDISFYKGSQNMPNSDVKKIGLASYKICDNKLIITHPVTLDSGHNVGEVIAAYSFDSINAENKKVAEYIRLIAALGTLVVLLGIFVFNWVSMSWLKRLAGNITSVASGELKEVATLGTPIKEFKEIDRAVEQLRTDALQLIELKSESRAAEQVKYMAMHDSLTDLENRHQLDEFLRELHALSMSLTLENKKDWLEVLHIDLNKFKEINDKYGHQFGDEVLITASRQLKAIDKNTGNIFRMGGDEFLIIRYHHGKTSSIDRYSPAFPEKIIRGFSDLFNIKGEMIPIDVSIGVVIRPLASLDIQNTLFDVDIALYSAKEKGKSCYALFSSPLRAERLEKQQLASDLERALEMDEICPYYQPKVDASTLALVGVEALARWHHPERGILTPDKFLPIAKERGLVGDIDRIIFQHVCQDIKQWSSEGYDVPSVSINLSAARLEDPSLLNDLKSASLPKGKISFELLETIYLDEVSDDLIETLTAIRDLGVCIEIDDFGSGHASIVSLLRIAPDRLKIDRAFVKDMTTSPQSYNLLKQIVDIGKNLNIPVTAEGVETQQQAIALAEFGCDMLQGYLFGKPCNVSEFTEAYISNEGNDKNQRIAADIQYLRSFKTK